MLIDTFRAHAGHDVSLCWGYKDGSSSRTKDIEVQGLTLCLACSIFWSIS